MKIEIVHNTREVDCDVLIVNKFENELTSNALINKFAPKSFKGKPGDLFYIHTQGDLLSKYVMAVGFGIEEELDSNIIRESIAKAVKKCKELEAKKIAFDINTSSLFGISTIIGAEIANYNFDKYKSKKDNKITKLYISNVSNNVKVAQFVAEGVNLARDLVNEPASYTTPTKLAEVAEGLAGIETTVFEQEDIAELGMGAYLAVAKGSVEPPKFIHMKYVPKNPKRKIALVGKGLCFDSGGLDIKPAASMLNMKDDMSGAATVIGIMSVIGRLQPEVEVHAVIAACENMPSGKAYKPGDILTAKNGKTIEVDNTDAEGRLTLADALCYACDLGVDEVIDIATLTGACMVALGSAASGIMGNNDEFVKEIINSGEYSGEKFWQLPMFKEYRENLNSDIADMKNTGSRYGGASSAGMFLNEFVSDKIRWAHIDIAGTAYLEKPQREFCKGATGVGVRTILNYILSF